jgi:hypothetical protein
MVTIDRVNTLVRARQEKKVWSRAQHCVTGLSLLLCLLFTLASAAEGPEIALDRIDHDFGDVQVGRVVQARIAVSNKGDAPLIIDKAHTSCGCTKAASADKEVPPGAKTEISVSYDSEGLSQGRKTQTVFIHSNDSKNPSSTIRIFANIVHPVSVDPSSLVVRLPRFQEHVSTPVTARNNSEQRVTLSVAGFEGAIRGASLQPENVSIEPNSEARFKIEMDLKRPEKGNALTGEVLIGTDLPGFSRIKLRRLVKFDQVE